MRPELPACWRDLVTAGLWGYQRRLIVTGTRDGRADVWDTLDLYTRLWGAPFLVLGGDLRRGQASAQGVDLQARQWAEARGVHGLVELAFWDALKRSAGPKRNARMVRWGRPGVDHLLAFPSSGESRGTHGCYALGQARGIFCVYVENGWPEKLAALEKAA